MNPDYTQDLRDFALTLGAMLVLVIIAPRWLIPEETLSQRAVALGIFKIALLAYALGAVIFFVLYARVNAGQGAMLLDKPLDRIGFLLSRSALIAMFWVPLLGFVWLWQAQAVERRRGENVVRDGGAK